MRTALLLVAAAIVLASAPAIVTAGYAGIFQSTGWKLLRVDSQDPVHIDFAFPRGEGYYADLHAVYTENGEYLWGHPGFFGDIGPGLYVDVAPVEDVEVAPNPTYTSAYQWSGTDVPAGVHYVFVGTAGEVSHWMLEAPSSTLIAEGPMHFKFVSHLEGGMAVEANAWFAAASVSRERSIEFEIEHTLIGVFGMPAAPITPATRAVLYEEGTKTLRFPDGTHLDCVCLYHFHDLARGPGRYVYEEDRAMFTQRRFPVAVWADVPLPFG